MVGPSDEFVEHLLGTTHNPHEKAQLETIQRERKFFRESYGALKKSLDESFYPEMGRLTERYSELEHGTEAEKATKKVAFVKHLAFQVARLEAKPEFATLKAKALTPQTLPHLMLREALTATALDHVSEEEWARHLEEAAEEATKTAKTERAQTPPVPAPAPAPALPLGPDGGVAVTEVGKIQIIDAILKELGGFIPLPTGGAIAASAPSQKLWVAVMGNNPSKFKERQYCPDTYQEVHLGGQTIGMCPGFPVERVAARSEGARDSDEEFITALNAVYQSAGRKERFRRQTRAEYAYADTEDGKHPKREGDTDLGDYTPYRAQQPRPMSKNKANSLGFRRSGVWEWTEDMESWDRTLVGGSWNVNPEYVASGYRYAADPSYRYSGIGPARLVRTP